MKIMKIGISKVTNFTDDDLKRLKEIVDSCMFFMHEQFDDEKLLALLARLEAAEDMNDFIAHDALCIRNRYSQGRPTYDGGYECMYDDKWYRSRPIDETPKCNCGLDEKWEAWRKSKGEK